MIIDNKVHSTRIDHRFMILSATVTEQGYENLLYIKSAIAEQILNRHPLSHPFTQSVVSVLFVVALPCE